MKQFFKMFFASLLAMIVGGVILVGITIGMIVSAVNGVKSQKNTSKSSQASILVIETDKHLHEQGEDNSFASFSNDISHSAGLYDVITALKKAKDDANIKGVLLKLQGGANSWATMEQLR